MPSDAAERFLCCVALLSFCSTVCLAQNAEAKVPPVIDVHVHAMDGNFPGLARVMSGTDQLLWPKLMAYSVSIIQNADYFTEQQKRDILYNNAARLLRIDTGQGK